MTDVPLWLIHIVAWQKPTQHFKVIILQLKKILPSQKLEKKKRKLTYRETQRRKEKKITQNNPIQI